MQIVIGAYILVQATIWGLVMIGCSLALKGTGMYQEIQNILVGGAVMSLFLGNTLVIVSAKKKLKEKAEQNEK